MANPLISIVTVVLNNKDALLKTLESVRNQNFKNFEYLVIDGQSSDGTIDCIKENNDIITKWISEKDKGIYDAMNKAINIAKGKYILFLNTGDSLHSPKTLEKIAPFLESNNHPIIYGSAEFVLGNKTKLFRPIKLTQAWKSMPFSHQACFILADYHKNHLYTLKYTIGADYHLIYNTISKHPLLEVNQVICQVSPGGVSDTKRFQSIKDRLDTINEHSFSPLKNSYYLYLFIDNLIRSLIKTILPKKLTRFLIEKKYNGHHTLL